MITQLKVTLVTGSSRPPLGLLIIAVHDAARQRLAPRSSGFWYIWHRVWAGKPGGNLLHQQHIAMPGSQSYSCQPLLQRLQRVYDMRVQKVRSVLHTLQDQTELWLWLRREAAIP